MALFRTLIRMPRYFSFDRIAVRCSAWRRTSRSARMAAPGAAGMTEDLLKLSLSDSSHLTAEALAGKLEPILLNFNTHKDCSWHVR